MYFGLRLFAVGAMRGNVSDVAWYINLTLVTPVVREESVHEAFTRADKRASAFNLTNISTRFCADKMIVALIVALIDFYLC